MIKESVYLEMKKLIKEYEESQASNVGSTKDIDKPYIIETTINQDFLYNPKFGDNRVCECGHSYYRHFDTYEEMATVGCKYCGCYEFKEEKSI